MADRQEITAKVTAALEELLAALWADVQPGAATDDLEDLDVAEVFEEIGQPYIGAWTLVLGIASVDSPEAPDLVIYYQQHGQPTWATRGILEQAIEQLER